MSPAALLDYDRARLRGLVLEEAGAASHIAIVARALGVPAVSDIPDISEIVEHGDPLIVDGLTGEVHLLPPPEVEAAYAEKARLRARRQDQYRALRDTPAVTLDGVARRPAHERRPARSTCRISHETGAQSIGLFRTELQFMLALRFPRLEDAGTALSRVLDAAGDKPVTFRTLDIGGDKGLPYMKGPTRRIRRSAGARCASGSTSPALLRMQMRAMLRAAAGRDCG